MDFSFWQETRDRLHQYFHQRVHDPLTAEDLLQEVLLQAYTKKAQVNDEERFSAWVFGIARNTLIDHYWQHRRQMVTLPLTEEPNFYQHTEDRTQEFSHCLIPMIQALPQPYREALEWSEIKGLSQKELASQLGISYSGAKSRVQRGREKLREMLLACCHIETDCYGNIVDYHPRVSKKTNSNA